MPLPKFSKIVAIEFLGSNWDAVWDTEGALENINLYILFSDAHPSLRNEFRGKSIQVLADLGK